ncbi:MAG TPA: YhfC family glutamic-type intramembrane protease, partial [Anaerolineales bacterium]|nr:YhfC family glutamic-type intramembrane protease [Anaerolineales bacterium]
MNIFVRVLNPIWMILIGLAAGVIVSKQRDVKWNLYGIGALTFIASQIFHIPFNIWLLNPVMQEFTSVAPQGIALLILAAALGLSAGFFEETARYLVYRFGIKDAREWKDALMFGAGHGGIEAILLGLLTFLSVLQLISLTGQDLSHIVPEDQLPLAQAQITAFWEIPWYGVLLGTVERAIALCFHIAASVLVLQAFQKQNIVWLLAAIGFHALLDAIAVYGSQIWGAYLTEGVLAIFTLLSLGIIFLFRPKDKQQEEIPLAP